MNRYQLEVAEMDRRHWRRVRFLSLIGTAGVVALALWSAGLLSPEWWVAARAWWSDKSPVTDVAMTAHPAAAPIEAAAPAPLAQGGAGDASSVSRRPQPLHLIATTPGRSNQEGTARIGTNRDNPQTYVAGALLANGARLTEIHRDHVLLERDGRQVALYLHTADAKRQPLVDDLFMVGGPPPKTPLPPLTREVLIDYMRPSPVFEDEVLRGYQVYPGRKAGVFSQLGLRSGDVITSIDDAPILDAATAIEALKGITNGTSIAVRVERNGKPERLVLDGALITNDLEQDKSPVAAPLPNDPAGA